MGKRIQSIFYAMVTMALLAAWMPAANAQFVMIQSNQDESCAISFNESGQVNIGTYLDGVCHLPEWDYMSSVLYIGTSDVSVTADGPQHNCFQVLIDSASNVSLSNANFDGAFQGVVASGGGNIALNNLSFQSGDFGPGGRALDIGSVQGLTASQLNFHGSFDRINVASSTGVNVSQSSVDLSSDAFTLVNIFESTGVSLNQITGNGGQGLMSAFNAHDVTINQVTATLSAAGTSASVVAFDSSDLTISKSTIDRRAISASADCFLLNGGNDVTISKNTCLDSATSSGSAMAVTIVKNFTIDKNLFEGVVNGIFASSDGVIPDNGQITKNTIKMTGHYGLFLSAVTEVEVIKNDITNTLGTGGAGAWYYDELGGNQLVINFVKNKYEGFAVNGECNSQEQICP